MNAKSSCNSADRQKWGQSLPLSVLAVCVLVYRKLSGRAQSTFSSHDILEQLKEKSLFHDFFCFIELTKNEPKLYLRFSCSFYSQNQNSNMFQFQRPIWNEVRASTQEFQFKVPFLISYNVESILQPLHYAALVNKFPALMSPNSYAPNMRFTVLHRNICAM